LERITISMEPQLASDLDAWMAKRSYGNRSEAMRDMIREQLGSDALDLGEAKWCIATLTYVYDRIEQ
jgi:CopG family transcriptional regulator, nickel-responsive regulator